MANTKISALTANTNPTGSEEFVYAYNNANGKITLNTLKAFVGGAGITTLNADANIWELADGIYESAYNFYYISGEPIPTSQSSSATRNHMLFVISEVGGGKAFFDFNVADITGTILSYSSFGHSYSSADGECNRIASREWTFKQYKPSAQTVECDAFGSEIVQKVTNASGTSTLRPSGFSQPYPGVTYTVYFESASSAYTVALGTGITNPFNITLPTSTTKKSIVNVLMTSTTTGIVTSCSIEP